MKNYSLSNNGHFEVIPNSIRDSKEHVQILDFSKLANCEYRLRTAMLEKRIGTQSNRRGMKSTIRGEFSMNSTQSSIPSILLKHVPIVKMNKVTCRDDLFD